MAAQKYSPGEDFAQHFHRTPQPRTIIRTISEGRAVRTRLAEWQITSQHRDATRGERFRHRDQQRRAAMRSRSVGQHQTCISIAIRTVQKSPHGWLTWRLIGELLNRSHTLR